MAVAAEQEWNHAMDRQQEVVARQAADGAAAVLAGIAMT